MAYIRTANFDDAKAVAELHARSWQENYRGMLSDDYLDNHVLSDRLALWQERLNNNNSRQIVYLAFADIHSIGLLGFICVIAEFHPVWGTLIDNLHVR